MSSWFFLLNFCFLSWPGSGSTAARVLPQWKVCAIRCSSRPHFPLFVFVCLFVCVVWCRTPPLLWSLPVSIHGKRSAGSTPSPRQQHGGPGPASSADSTAQEETRGFQIRQNPGRGLLLHGTSLKILFSVERMMAVCKCAYRYKCQHFSFYYFPYLDPKAHPHSYLWPDWSNS